MPQETLPKSSTPERIAVLKAKGEAGGKAVIIVTEAMILDGVKQLRGLTDQPITIEELESLQEVES